MRQVYDLALQTYYDRPEDWFRMVEQAMKRDLAGLLRLKNTSGSIMK